MRDPQDSERLICRTAAAVATGAVMLALVLAVATAVTGLGRASAAVALALYGLSAVLLVGRVRAHHPFERFGPGNLTTLLRLWLICLIAAAAAESATSDLFRDSAAAWLVTGVAVTALALDGVDGALARRSATTSAFGARFDSEVDALLMLLLATLAFLLGKAGVWILLAGALRYLFLAAAIAWPELGAPLPPSWRRKAVGAVQILVLVALLTPLLVPPASRLLAAGGLVLLVCSFAVDVLWLTRQGRLPPSVAANGARRPHGAGPTASAGRR